jgi:hypothetical protein
LQPEKVRNEINKWVSKATNKLITSILPQGAVDSKTALVLANAIYFKGTWSKPFRKLGTWDKEFHRLDGSCVLAPYMHSSEDQFIQKHHGFKVLKLPYRRRCRNSSSSSRWYVGDDDESDQSDDDERPRFSMCIFLPDAGDGLPGLVDKMAAPRFRLPRHLPTSRVSVGKGKFCLPKFELSFSSQMDETLGSRLWVSKPSSPSTRPICPTWWRVTMGCSWIMFFTRRSSRWTRKEPRRHRGSLHRLHDSKACNGFVVSHRGFHCCPPFCVPCGGEVWSGRLHGTGPRPYSKIRVEDRPITIVTAKVAKQV